MSPIPPRTLVLATLACALLPAAASPATYHVTPAGSDANPCSQPQPCREIRKALSLVTAGDAILVADGSYKGFDVEDLHGSPASPIRIQALGTNARILPTTDRPDNRDTVFVTFSSYVTLDGLRSLGANRAAVRVDQSQSITVRNGVFGDNQTWGIFTDFSDDLLIENNECYGSVIEHGIYVSNSGDRPVVRGNRIHDNHANGLHMNGDIFSGGDGIISGALVENNVIYNNGTGGGSGINMDGVQDSVIRNNLVYANHATGIGLYQIDGAEGPSGNSVYHNTVDVAADGRYALLIKNTAGPNSVRNNILFNRHPSRGGINYLDASDVANTDSDYNVLDRITPDDGDTVLTLAQWQAQGHEPHSLSASLASLFASPASADYHLKLGSPAIDAGQTLVGVGVDIAGLPRPLGNASDVGCYEFAGGPPLSVNDVSALEGAGTLVFELSLAEAAAEAVSVHYATANGSAVAGVDYSASSGTLSFAPGELTQTLAVTLLDDTLDENDETFTLALSNALGASLVDAVGIATVGDDDPLPTVSIDDPSVDEGNSGMLNVVFNVSLSGPSGRPVTLGYATADGSATAPTDYASRSGTLSFNPGQTERTLSVPVSGDIVAEPDETFLVSLGTPVAAMITDAQGVASIVNDDAPDALQFGHPSYSSSEAGPAAAILVTRTGAAAGNVTVSYATSNGSATAAVDYAATSGTLTFGVGVRALSLAVPLTNDEIVEGSESVLLGFSPAGGATLGSPSTALLTITDNDLGGAIRFSGASYNVSESLGSATITATRTGGTGGPVLVNYQTSAGTATAGSDYTTAAGTLTFAAGQTSRTFTVPILADTDDEDNESVGLTLSGAAGGATLGSPTSATLTIVDNDTAGSVQFSVSAYTVDESSASALMTATRSGGSAGPVTVDYQTANGSATAGSDYTATSGTLTFGPGILSQSFGVPITNDGSVEGPETVDLTLSNPTGRLTLGARKTALLTITDDEPGVTLHFGAPGYTVAEGSLATLSVKRSGPTTSALTVDYQTQNGSALAGSDYTAAAGTLSFKAGISIATFKVTTTGDSADESDEDLSLSLSNPTGGAILGTQATATLEILDNDAGGALKFGSAAYSRSEGLPTATITVSRSGGLAGGVTVAYASSDGTAQAGSDYTTTSGTLSFAAGQPSRTFTLPILADDLDEDNEGLTLQLSSPTGGATLGSPATTALTITDDDTDGVIQFSVSGYTVAEGGGPATLTLTRSGGKAGPVTLDYQTSDGTAQAGSDYTASSGTLTFNAGVLSQTFPVPIADDGTVEGAETVNLALGNPSGGVTLGARSTALLTITDDEAAPTLHFSAPSYSASEGASAVITVKRSGSTAGAVSVDYASSDGTATVADSDYTAKSGTLSFKAGQLSLTFTLATKTDTRDESNEDVNLALSNPTGGAILGTQATAALTIVDNDAGGALKFGAASYSKTEAGPTATLTVTRTGGVASGVTVDYASTNGTAQAGSDYVAAAGTLGFGAGQASRTFTVALTNDTLDEVNETLSLTLSNPTGGATLGSPLTTTLTILDNDVAGTLQFSAGSYSVGESDGTATVMVTRSGGAASGVTVNYTTSNGSAQAGSDYTAASGTLTFGANETTKTFAVPITPDGSGEANETVTLTLSAPGGGAALGSPAIATLYIVDDD